MTRPDDELRLLLHDAVADLEPADRLTAIRARTRERRPRKAWWTAGGVALVAAAVVTVIAVSLGDHGGRDGTDPATAPGPTPPCSPTARRLVCIADPTERAEVNDVLVARGWANSFEANVPWQVLDAEGERVLEGFATAEGWMDRLYPWEAEIDVSALDPGRYTFVASTEDPSGGAEGPGPHTDTRTFVIE